MVKNSDLRLHGLVHFNVNASIISGPLSRTILLHIKMSPQYVIVTENMPISLRVQSD